MEDDPKNTTRFWVLGQHAALRCGRRAARAVPGIATDRRPGDYGVAEASSLRAASTENPLGPRPRVRQAIAEPAADVPRYPDRNSFALKSALATRFGVSREQIVL